MMNMIEVREGDVFCCTPKMKESYSNFNDTVYKKLGYRPFTVLKMASPLRNSDAKGISAIMQNGIVYTANDFGEHGGCGYWCIFTQSDLEKEYISKLQDPADVEFDDVDLSAPEEKAEQWVVQTLNTKNGSKVYKDFTSKDDAEKFAKRQKLNAVLDVRVIIFKGVSEIELTTNIKDI